MLYTDCLHEAWDSSNVEVGVVHWLSAWSVGQWQCRGRCCTLTVRMKCARGTQWWLIVWMYSESEWQYFKLMLLFCSRFDWNVCVPSPALLLCSRFHWSPSPALLLWSRFHWSPSPALLLCSRFHWSPSPAPLLCSRFDWSPSPALLLCSRFDWSACGPSSPSFSTLTARWRHPTSKVWRHAWWSTCTPRPVPPQHPQTATFNSRSRNWAWWRRWSLWRRTTNVSGTVS